MVWESKGYNMVLQSIKGQYGLGIYKGYIVVWESIKGYTMFWEYKRYTFT